ncbi:hypothetical protein AYO40_02420 [Planctomycetaceae bacterium SCGC AG-212-D15]|nr:hypothetical protein AYO40_02420 [Planctomycetaceae bacterium SCGC AG-212-D15]
MKPKTMILMILAIVCGLVASYMTSQLIAQNKEEVMVLAAKERINQWGTIREPKDMFELKPILKKNAPAMTFNPQNWEETLKGRRAKVAIEKDGILTDDQLLKKEVTGLDIPPGKQAMAVPISADKAVSFFVVPGCRVNVIHTVGGVSTVLLPNALVLAIDLNTNRPEDKVGIIGGTCTLQLDSDDQVLKLSSARDRGNLSLVMKSQGDDPKETTEDPKVAALAPPPPPPPPPTFEDEKPKEVPGSVKPVETTKVAQKALDIIDGTQKGVRITYILDKDNNVVDIKAKTFDDIYKERATKAAPKTDEKAKPEKPEDSDR